MTGTKVIAIRIAVSIMLIIATFAVVWYVFSRFSEIEGRQEYFTTQEVNNPRINHTKLREIIEILKQRESFASSDWIQTKEYEDNPFYNPNIQVETEEVDEEDEAF